MTVSTSFRYPRSLTTFGEGGRQPAILRPHSIATDSKGNIYVTEPIAGSACEIRLQGLVRSRRKIQGVSGLQRKNSQGSQRIRHDT